METLQLKTGKLPAKYDKKALHLSHFTPGEPPVAPKGFNSTNGMGIDTNGWGMLGNDEYGDCGWAGAGHETEILTYLGGHPVTVDAEDALSDYSDCTGFNPNDPDSDQGTDMGQEMSYRRKKGVIDTAGNRHKIGAYLHLEPGNFHELLQGLHAFGVVGIGIEFPDYAMDQYNNNKPWTLVKGAPHPTEGHYIPGVARPMAESIAIITWGRFMLMSKGFYEKYNDESYVFVSEEMLKNGKSPTGYDLSELNDILNEL